MDEDDPAVMLICKPEADTQGRGIFIAKSFESMQRQIEAFFAKKEREQEDLMKQARMRLYEQEQTAINKQRDEASKNGLARVAVHLPRDWNKEEKI